MLENCRLASVRSWPISPLVRGSYRPKAAVL